MVLTPELDAGHILMYLLLTPITAPELGTNCQEAAEPCGLSDREGPVAPDLERWLLLAATLPLGFALMEGGCSARDRVDARALPPAWADPTVLMAGARFDAMRRSAVSDLAKRGGNRALSR
jgi:hypothetical protein